ncbi:MAG: hypothetical protein AB7V56_03355 [Candidatus Nitrosocosmicus sp.]
MELATDFIDNDTFFNIDTKELGNLYAGYHKDKDERGTPGEISVASVIVPIYGTHVPYFSASIPFVVIQCGLGFLMENHSLQYMKYLQISFNQLA